MSENLSPRPAAEGMDVARVSALTREILGSVRGNYIVGPISPERALEALNALASAAAVIIAGCDGLGGGAEKFFYHALSVNLKFYCERGESFGNGGAL